jgi:biotin-dependent carboxylase-like uncharacterized protein
VSPSGFADWLSARAANRVVGNAQNAALIETTMTGVSFKALRTLRIAVTGAVAQLNVSGGAKALWQSVRVRAGGEVKISVAQRGLRSYVAFYGGIDIPSVLGSPSTDITAGFGGVHGRALARGDMLSLRPTEGEFPEEDKAIAVTARPFWRQPALLRVLPGPHAKRLSPEDLAFVEKQTYRVSQRSNRQGVRLEGRAIPTRGGFDVLSSGVCAGCVQLTSEGLPIILLAEHQTTGGYAVPLVVITADLPDAAQMRPGDEVRFRVVTFPEAAAGLGEKMQALSEPLHEPSATG